MRFATSPWFGVGAGGREERAKTSDTTMAIKDRVRKIILPEPVGARGEVGDGGDGDGHRSWAPSGHPLLTSGCLDVVQGITHRVGQGQGHQQQADAPVGLLMVEVLEASWLQHSKVKP